MAAPGVRWGVRWRLRAGPVAARALAILVKLGIAREITGGQRHRLFAYDAYLAILSEGAEPL